MDMHTDSFGTPIEVGDVVVFVTSRGNGSTNLYKSIIHSFTKSGNPRVYVKTYVRGVGYVEDNSTVRALTGSYAKAVDSINLELPYR